MHVPEVSAFLVDAAGTLLHLRESVGETYARIGGAFGVTRSPEEIQRGFRAAFRTAPAPMFGDGREFWRHVVTSAAGVEDDDYFEAVYAAFGAPAWSIAPDALQRFDDLRDAGVGVAIVSNWDTRLRAILKDLDVMAHIDIAVISSSPEIT
ncbi:MAG: HAD family hydrolase, partial [Myxococcota bacterium]